MSNPRYDFGLPVARLLPLTDDLKVPRPDRLIGGGGPFDFSGVAVPTAAELTIKQDQNTPIVLTIDISTAVDTSAVTAAELATALNTAFDAELPALDYTASVENGRIKIAYDGVDSPEYVQLYQEVARIARFGQGYDLKFIVTDTLRSLNYSPNMREQQTFSTVDANGIETEVITDGYMKGIEGTMVETASRKDLKALIEGGSLDATTGVYEAPTSESQKPYFLIEAFRAKYLQGTNKRRDLVGYEKVLVRSCVGMTGDVTMEENFSDGNFSFMANSYRDENDVLNGTYNETPLTRVEYEQLDVLNT